MTESKSLQGQPRRAIILVVDGCGVGAAPDAAAFGDESTCNSLANTASAVGGLKLPVMRELGLGNICSVDGLEPVATAGGFFGKMQELSRGKDTQTGHWEMMGLVSQHAFPLFPDGFPKEIIDQFVNRTGCTGVLCNKPASGTAVIEEFGPEHARTGKPIVYTSGDSVFQIACNTEVIPLERLYDWCQIARDILQGPHRVGRVIARPFVGAPGSYRRLSKERRDYGVMPPEPTLLDKIVARGGGVLGIGKIEDIFNQQGLTHAQHTGTNREGLELTLQAIKGNYDLAAHRIVEPAPDKVQVIFTNLVDTDMLFGHRRNPRGYAGALTEIDSMLAEILEAMSRDDLLIISSDHGNDPTAPGTDHTREFVPLISFAKAFAKDEAAARATGVRQGFYDIAATIAGWLDMPWQGPGSSFLPELPAVKAH